MDKEVIKVSPARYTRMQEDIERIRIEIDAAMEDVRRASSADGDARENTSLDIADANLNQLRSQLLDAQKMLKTVVVEHNVDTSKVGVLTQVRLHDDTLNREVVCSIVSTSQGGLGSNGVIQVSVGSKLGEALIGRKKGDVIKYQDNRFVLHTVTILDITEDM